MRALAPVWNGTERRLRAPVRVALTALVAGLTGAGLGAALSALPTPSTPQVTVLVGTALTAVAVAVGVGVAAVLLDRRRLRGYGLALDGAWLRDLVAGTALGALLMTGILAVSLAAGWATVVDVGRVSGRLSLPAAFALVAAAFVLVAVGEELAVRGYLLTNLAEGLQPLGDRAATAGAVGLSSLVFGGLHAANPSATAVSVAGISLAGVMLGLGYVLTGRLGVPVGLHFSWNLFQGPVYGFPVSGIDLGVSLLVLEVSGPTALTGGAFGPEAGLLGVGSVVVGTAVVVAYARRLPAAPTLAAFLSPDLRWWAWASPVDESTGGVDPRVARADESPDDR